MGYLGVYNKAQTEKIIERSRFITYVSRAESDEAAKAFLAGLRAEHAMATHVCYGYIADGAGNLQRYSDDGEPQGTAGLPILGVIKAKNLYCTAVAVVRYFGGIKLGAGGLTRAYCACAQEGLQAAEIREYDYCVRVTLTVAYPEVNALMNFLEKRGFTEYEKSFGENASFTVAVREREASAVLAGAREYLNGKLQIAEGERSLYPF